MNTIAAAWALAVKDLKGFVRDRTALVLSLLVPIALVSVFGWIMAYAFGGGSGGGMPQISLHVADLAQTERSRAFVQQIDDTEMVAAKRVSMGEAETKPIELTDDVVNRLQKMVRDGDAHHVLMIPPNFDEEIDAGNTPAFKMFRDSGRELEDRMVQLGLMQACIAQLGGNVFTDAMDRMLEADGMPDGSREFIRSWMTEIGSEIGSFYDDGESGDRDPDSGQLEESSSEAAGQPTTPSTDASKNVATGNGATGNSVSGNGVNGGGAMDGMFDFMSSAVPVETIDVDPPNRSQRVTYQQAQSVAGMTVMMLLFALTSCGSVLLTEREEGTLRRLFAQPISRNAVLLGKFFFVMIVGIVQMAVLFTYGEWMFGVGLFRDPVTLIVLSFTWVAAGGAFGMFLASFSKSTKQAESLASLLILMMAALGGCWFPLQLMNLPPFLEAICKSTMTYWAMTGFQGMLWNQLPWYSEKTLIALAWQWGWAAVFVGAAIYFFRRNFCRG